MARIGDPRTGGDGPDETREPESTRIFHALRRLMRAMDLRSRKLVAETGVTSAQLYCLRAVAIAGRGNATEIARHVHLSPSTVVGILDRLEGSALIERNRDENDRRVVNVTATPEGQALIRSALDPVQSALNEALDEISRTRFLDVAIHLEELADILDLKSPSSEELHEVARYEEATEEDCEQVLARPSDTQQE